MNTREKLGLPDPDSPLIRAARENDALVDSGGLEHALRVIGVNFQTLRHIAEQRALRLRLIQTGRISEVQQQSPATIDGTTRQRLLNQDPYYPKLSAEDNEAITMLTSLYMDAIAIGWRGHQFETEQS